MTSPMPELRLGICLTFSSFLKAFSSRSNLGMSREQMEAILSSHQVMAPFLRHVFTFKNRAEAYLLASFTSEDFLNSYERQPGLAEWNRSGILIQHSFNILGTESSSRNTSGVSDWHHRQVVAYHSFDLLNWRSTWIIMKGNASIEARFQNATEIALDQQPGYPTSLSHAFYESLKEHLLILKWGIENWSHYINALEEKCKTVSSILLQFKRAGGPMNTSSADSFNSLFACTKVAIFVVDQNKRVFRDIRNRYQQLAGSPNFDHTSPTKRPEGSACSTSQISTTGSYALRESRRIIWSP